MADLNLDSDKKSSLCNEFLGLSIPDNDQTWLYSLPGSDPHSVLDLTEFLTFKSCLTSKPVQEDDRGGVCTPVIRTKTGYPINTRTFTRHKKQNLCGIERKELNYYNQNYISQDVSTRTQERSPMAHFSSQSLQLDQKPDKKLFDLENTNNIKTEQCCSYVVGQETFDVFSKFNSLNNNTETKSNDLSNLMDVSDHTFLMDVSVPKGLMDSTFSCGINDSFQLSKHPFKPTSVSTPTRDLEKFKYVKNINKNKTVEQFAESCVITNKSTFESSVNNTYNISVTSDDHVDDINMNITHIVSSPTVTFESPVKTMENTELKGHLKSTFILEDSVEDYFENPVSLCADSIYSPPKNEMIGELKDDVNFPYSSNAEMDLNSTMIIKSKDNDSEQDSCYSSSSNLRSLDVCATSELQFKKKTGEFKLKKARSENHLYCTKDMKSLVLPDKLHGSVINLPSHHSNQCKGDEYQEEKLNNFCERQEKPAGVAIPAITPKDGGIKKTSCTRQASKIPRPQSRIPKLNRKRNDCPRGNDS